MNLKWNYRFIFHPFSRLLVRYSKQKKIVIKIYKNHMFFCSLFSLMPHLLSGIVFYTIFIFFCLNIYKSLLSGFYHKINLFVFIIILVILGWSVYIIYLYTEGGKTWLNLWGNWNVFSSFFPAFIFQIGFIF